MDISPEELTFLLRRINSFAVSLFSSTASTSTIRPPSATLSTASTTLLQKPLPTDATPISESLSHLLTEVIPSAIQSTSPTFYGFVTGGTTPAALLADHIATVIDQNVMVHLPNDTISTIVEKCAMGMLCDLVNLPRNEWLAGGTLTTGATASNVLGLALGREFLLRNPNNGKSVSEVGYLKASMDAGATEGIKVIACMPHSSIGKAASIVGIGREEVLLLPHSEKKPWDFNIDALGELLSTSARAKYIVVAQHGEVNTGKFSRNLRKIREICDKYGAWLHVDAAFGLVARCLRDMEDSEGVCWRDLYCMTEGLELADSITGDGHKLLNVPYDCGIFFTRHAELLPKVFANVGAAYLPPSTDGIVSPSNINIENSRRFRALPVYATLSTYGFKGYQRMISNLVIHARQISKLISSSPFSDHLELLSGPIEETYNIVLFKAKDAELNKVLTEKINTTGRMWVSGTTWIDGQPAVRIAVGNWKVDENCVEIVQGVLAEVCGVQLEQSDEP